MSFGGSGLDGAAVFSLGEPTLGPPVMALEYRRLADDGTAVPGLGPALDLTALAPPPSGTGRLARHATRLAQLERHVADLDARLLRLEAAPTDLSAVEALPLDEPFEAPRPLAWLRAQLTALWRWLLGKD